MSTKTSEIKYGFPIRFIPLKQLLLTLTLAALKFFRSCINLQNEYYNRQITQSHIFEPILNILFETMPRDNLLNSACLEIFEFIKHQNIRPFIHHIVENYRERIDQIKYVDTFQIYIVRYDQMQEFNPELDTTLFTADDETAPNLPKVNGNQRWQGVKEMDATEREYFDNLDNEDDFPTKKGISNGVSPLLKSLVDYPDDDEDIMDTKPHSLDPLSSSPQSFKSESPSPSTATSNPSSPSTPLKSTLSIPQTPPERLAEKRRREEDDEEDELGRLTITKRRSSSVSSANSPTNNSPNNILRRKKPFATNSSKNSPTSGKKIEISLALKRSSSTDAKRDEGG